LSEPLYPRTYTESYRLSKGKDMWTISGQFYDLQKGTQKAAELGKRLAREFREELDKSVLEAKASTLADYQARVHAWEINNKAIIDQHKTKLARDKKVRNGIGLALILCLLTYPFILLVGRWLASSEPLSNLLVVLRCGIPVLFAFGTILYLGMLLSYNTNKKNQPGFAPKPEVSRRLYDSYYLFMDEPAYWRFMVSETSNFLLTNENYGSEGELRLADRLGEIVPFDYLCLRGVLVDKNLDADVILIGHKGIWALESKFYSGNIILNNGSWYRKKTYYEPGGYQKTKEEYLDDFTNQWQREKQSIVKILKDSGVSADICRRVSGGLVFTHPDAILSIDGSANISVGDIEFWTQKLTEEITRESDKILLTGKEMIEIADALLTHSNNLDDGETKSLVDLAHDRYKQEKLSIVTFIEEQKSSLEKKAGSKTIVTTSD